ncbi:hypothetical protein WICPIJ_008436 [Wickerhamomyces pijperi]|uniref:Uncharacterized protein n=1 Tax=Wickerhamomyces pijperi TaxID=599730 RepID=A0A9P8PX32_WICPI|nr:hypothetical protein WICPIJ_008436 [Wickerhamomyces pijperi]
MYFKLTNNKSSKAPKSDIEQIQWKDMKHVDIKAKYQELLDKQPNVAYGQQLLDQLPFFKQCYLEKLHKTLFGEVFFNYTMTKMAIKIQHGGVTMGEGLSTFELPLDSEAYEKLAVDTLKVLLANQLNEIADTTADDEFIFVKLDVHLPWEAQVPEVVLESYDTLERFFKVTKIDNRGCIDMLLSSCDELLRDRVIKVEYNLYSDNVTPVEFTGDKKDPLQKPNRFFKKLPFSPGFVPTTSVQFDRLFKNELLLNVVEQPPVLSGNNLYYDCPFNRDFAYVKTTKSEDINFARYSNIGMRSWMNYVPYEAGSKLARFENMMTPVKFHICGTKPKGLTNEKPAEDKPKRELTDADFYTEQNMEEDMKCANEAIAAKRSYLQALSLIKENISRTMSLIYYQKVYLKGRFHMHDPNSGILSTVTSALHLTPTKDPALEPEVYRGPINPHIIQEKKVGLQTKHIAILRNPLSDLYTALCKLHSDYRDKAAIAQDNHYKKFRTAYEYPIGKAIKFGYTTVMTFQGYSPRTSQWDYSIVEAWRAECNKELREIYSAENLYVDHLGRKYKTKESEYYREHPDEFQYVRYRKIYDILKCIQEGYDPQLDACRQYNKLMKVVEGFDLTDEISLFMK